MAVPAIVPEFGHPQPPEPGLTPEEVIARAETIAATLVPRQHEVEERTFYGLDVHERFREAGFYRILVPRRYGGYEFGVDTFIRVSMALCRGCPSTGWMYTLGAAHALAVATLFDERVQDEVFAGGDFICPATVLPAGTAVRAPDGGWTINGTWSYCSGSPYASHFLGHVLVTPEEGAEPVPMMFIAPRDQWRRLDDWGALMGLKGSGSHSITIENGHIPAHYAMDTHLSLLSVTDGTPGAALHGNPMYGGGPMSFMVVESGALAVGIAKGAVDAYEDLMRSRNTLFPPIVPRTEDPDFQYWYGEASGLIATAEAAIMNTIHEWQRMCEEGPAAFTRERELHLASVVREVVRLAWRAVEHYAFPTAGSSAVRTGERIERHWRDLSTVMSHGGIAIFLNAMAVREYARVKLGVEH
ncbi:acyl-CoA dehydrogenase [Actinophytocola xinjiangensis]|uniref:Acyl-CoA dehydrogenase n=1 Tax=Actinophytocola xinjiangensis TaxID=485602 RepID=A0A7Z1AV58_9PSEU|nr:acyl-CoA dehydrogenase family protein [Actinophytocola xinjiangensis]OLF05992.1 acyl-CoA dehydrogenase [Actinophytocola xinjiangensis]